MIVDNISAERVLGLSDSFIESYQDIDEVLGDKRERYFGEGYRRVNYHVNSVTKLSDDTFQLKLGVCYPRDWSSKKHGKVSPPHLSTVDAAYLAVVLGEWFVYAAYGISKSNGDMLQLLSCEIHSGAVPDEQLDDLAVKVKEISRDKIKSIRSLCRLRSTVSIKLGRMDIVIIFAHSGKAKSEVEGSFSSADILNMPYKYGHACNQAIKGVTNMDIGKLSIDKLNKKAQAVLKFSSDSSGYRELSLVEVVLASAQLAQAVIYRIDNVPRSKSNTLWMRDFTIEKSQPFKVKNEQQGSIHTLSHKQVRNNSVLWSVYRFICFVGAVGTCFTFAHQLPKDELSLGHLNK